MMEPVVRWWSLEGLCGWARRWDSDKRWACSKLGNTDCIQCTRPHDVAGLRPATSWGVHYTTSCNTQSSAPEDGQNNFPKPVELTGIINKSLLLHLVGCLYYLYQ